MKAMILNSQTGDIEVKNGAIALGYTSTQIIELILKANRGEFKEYPLIGGEIVKLLNGVNDVFWPAKVKDMMLTCGVKVSRVKVDGNTVSVE